MPGGLLRFLKALLLLPYCQIPLCNGLPHLNNPLVEISLLLFLHDHSLLEVSLLLLKFSELTLQLVKLVFLSSKPIF